VFTYPVLDRRRVRRRSLPQPLIVDERLPHPVRTPEIRPIAAALANAVFDAPGVRLRRAPITPERLKPALA
jgi:nicotinate dehydrogenase subunit B